MRRLPSLEMYKYLSKKQTSNILDAAVKLLEKTGIRILDEKVLQSLEQKGYKTTQGRICITEQESLGFLDKLRQDEILREDILQKSNRSRLEGVMGSYCLRFQQPGSKRAEPFSTETLIAATKFATLASQKYKNFTSFAPGVPDDLPPELDSLIKYKISAEYGNGTIPIEPTSLLAAKYMFPMAECMGQPIGKLPVYTVSPLSLGGDSLDLVLKYKDKLSSFYVFGMPSLGCTAPLSISQGLAMCLAEVLGAGLLVHALTGLRCEIRPQIYPFDLQIMNYAFGSPRKFIYERISEDFTAQLLGMPLNSHSANIHTNCAVSGVQSGMEKTSLLTAAAFSGATKFYCIGTLSLDEVFSPAELILDAARIEQVEQMLAIPSMEELGDLPLELAPYLESGFVCSDKTLDEHENYINYSSLINRVGYSGFTNGQNREMFQQAEEEAKNLMQTECEFLATKEQVEEIHRLYKAAETECKAG